MGTFKLNFKSRFWVSCGNTILLLVLTFLPLTINLFIAAIPAINKTAAIESKIVPGEMLAYCLSLIAPLFLFLLKTHGTNFRMPALQPVFIFSILLYSLALVLTLIAKNGLIPGIDLNGGHRDFYFWVSIGSLVGAIALKLYTDFHDSRHRDFYKKIIDKQQQDFNSNFRNSLDQA